MALGLALGELTCADPFSQCEYKGRRLPPWEEHELWPRVRSGLVKADLVAANSVGRRATVPVTPRSRAITRRDIRDDDDRIGLFAGDTHPHTGLPLACPPPQRRITNNRLKASLVQHPHHRGQGRVVDLKHDRDDRRSA